MATVNMTPIKGEQTVKTFELGHAQRILDLQKKCPPASWKLTDAGYIIIDGTITAKPVTPAPVTPAPVTPAPVTPVQVDTTSTDSPSTNNASNGPTVASPSSGTDTQPQK